MQVQLGAHPTYHHLDGGCGRRLWDGLVIMCAAANGATVDPSCAYGVIAGPTSQFACDDVSANLLWESAGQSLFHHHPPFSRMTGVREHDVLYEFGMLNRLRYNRIMAEI